MFREERGRHHRPGRGTASFDWCKQSHDSFLSGNIDPFTIRRNKPDSEGCFFHVALELECRAYV